MSNPQDTPPKDPVRARHAAAEPEELLLQQIRDLLEREHLQSALRLFNTLHPADQGNFLVDLPRESQQELLAEMPPGDTADILERLSPDEAAHVSERLRAPALAHILDEASPDVAADVLRNIPAEHSEETLQEMAEAEDVIPLLQYPDDTAGGLMSSDYIAVRDDITAGVALDSLRLQSSGVEHASYVLAVGADGRLTGVVDIVHLALTRPSVRVSDIMDRKVVSVAADTDQEDCARLVQRYELGALPVVDAEGLLLGVIFGEDLVGVLVQEATEDMYRIAALEGETVFGPLLGSVRSRLPWLYVNLGTTFLAALVIALFESTIARVVALAVFLPIVPGQGGIGGTQTLTLVVRSMALGELPGRLGIRLVARELLLGTVHGLLLGLGVAAAVYLWKGNLMLSFIIGIAMMGNMLVAGLTGAGVPLLLRRLGMDPAVSSAVFITTVTDVLGLLMFLGLATALVSFLV